MKSKRWYDENDEVDAKYAEELAQQESDQLNRLLALDRLEQSEQQEQRTGTIDEDEFDG